MYGLACQAAFLQLYGELSNKYEFSDCQWYIVFSLKTNCPCKTTQYSVCNHFKEHGVATVEILYVNVFCILYVYMSMSSVYSIIVEGAVYIEILSYFIYYMLKVYSAKHFTLSTVFLRRS